MVCCLFQFYISMEAKQWTIQNQKFFIYFLIYLFIFLLRRFLFSFLLRIFFVKFDASFLFLFHNEFTIFLIYILLNKDNIFVFSSKWKPTRYGLLKRRICYFFLYPLFSFFCQNNFCKKINFYSYIYLIFVYNNSQNTLVRSYFVTFMPYTIF